MLIEFRVENFKNFKEELIFKLNDIRNYEFNIEAIENGVIKNSLIYGVNGSGKSNLGLALFDISVNLTDKPKNKNVNKLFLNLFTKKNTKFYYKFKFDSSYLEYRYEKSNSEQIVDEKLYINNKIIISYNHEEHEGFVNLDGAETLNTNLGESNIAFVKYIKSNTVLNIGNEENRLFKNFIDFIDKMILVSSLENNQDQGFINSDNTVADRIIKLGKLKEFEGFLKNAGFDYKLVEKKVDDKDLIYCDFNGSEVNFYSICSKGESRLALLYSWLIQLDKKSLVFIDEFDSFYHNNLAKLVLKEILKLKCQTIIVAHNTSTIDNDLLRPDCYFNLTNNKIKSFASRTKKDLRKVHNLENLYRSGSF